jgi:beta-fructofuranosidase
MRVGGHDDIMRLFPALCLSGILLMPVFLRAETDQEALVRAEAAVKAATARAQADPAHPVFHVSSPAQWMNDPNGPIFYRGWYHLFYQLTPFSDRSGVKYWGHVRSRDLATWENLPIAIAPSGDLGEDSIWSGCCTINGEGQPMVFYTSIGKEKSAFDQATQWAAIGDQDLVHWQKSPANPVLSDAVNGGTKIYDWRDPFIFQNGKKTFLVLGGHLAKDKHAAVNIYEAENPALTQWKYRGPLFELPDAPTVECPNFFKLGKEWVLFVSPYGKVQYFIGSFDATTCRFTARTNGMLDAGNFYAPNTMLVPDGRRLVWGWVNGFPDDRGWNGCLSLPRELNIARDGQLHQAPSSALEKLRGKAVVQKNIRLQGGAINLTLPGTNALEISLEMDLSSAAGIGLEIKNGNGRPGVTVNFTGSELEVMDVRVPLNLNEKSRRLNLRLFVDHSVLEVFANETACVTKVIAPLESGASLELRATGGPVQVKRLEAWPMKSIW